jgi:hypothetical protein
VNPTGSIIKEQIFALLIESFLRFYQVIVRKFIRIIGDLFSTIAHIFEVQHRAVYPGMHFFLPLFYSSLPTILVDVAVNLPQGYVLDVTSHFALVSDRPQF